MSRELINSMVNAVNEGHSPRKVLETSLTYAPGSSVRVNKATRGTDPDTGASVSVPEGTVVTIIGVGGGGSGVDHHVRLESGDQAVIPFMDLGEADDAEFSDKELKAMMSSVRDLVKKVAADMVGVKVNMKQGAESTELVVSSDDRDSVKAAHIEIQGTLKKGKFLRTHGTGEQPVNVEDIRKEGSGFAFSVTVAKA
jgi:hypothetical protein